VFPFKFVQNVNVLLALHSRAMNQEESDILCCPQDVNTNKFSQFNFALFRSFCYILPHRHGCYAFSEQIIISQQQPSIGANWIHFKLVRICFFRCSCSIGMQHPKHAPDHLCKLIFSFSFFFKNQKAKGRHLTPTVSLVRMRRVSRDAFEREKNNGFHIRLWNRMIFLATISIIRKCYPSLFVCTFPPYTFAYYINFSTFVI
jgi:hypothetical protein